MNILLIDSSAKKLRLLIKRGEEVFFHEDKVSLTHSVTLLPALEQLLTEAKLSIDEIDYASSIIGPGSFTGLRIGAATLKGLFLGKKTQLFVLDSLRLLSFEANGVPCYCLVSDVGGWHYFAAYDASGGEMIKPCAMRSEDIKVLLESVDKFSFFVGDIFEFTNPNIISIEPDYKDIMLAAAIDAVEQKKFVDINDFELLYLRKPQAEGD